MITLTLTVTGLWDVVSYQLLGRMTLIKGPRYGVLLKFGYPGSGSLVDIQFNRDNL